MNDGRAASMVAATVCSGLATLAVTVVSIGAAGGGASLMLGDGPASDRTLGGILLATGGIILLPVAVTMVVSIVRLLSRPPRGAAPMIACLRVMGGFVLVVVAPLTLRSGTFAAPAVMGLVGIGLFGIAALLARAVRPAGAGAR